MTAGRLPPASLAGQQTQIFHISTGTRRNNNCGYLLLCWYFPQNHYKGLRPAKARSAALQVALRLRLYRRSRALLGHVTAQIGFIWILIWAPIPSRP